MLALGNQIKGQVMPLQMPAQWRFRSPGPLPIQAAREFNELVHKIAGQSESAWSILELFKTKFGGASRSSDEGWATSDLHQLMMGGAENAPAFIASFWEGCEQVQRHSPLIAIPDATIVNQVLLEFDVPYELRPPQLLPRHQQTPIAVAAPAPSVGDQATTLIRSSLEQAEQLLVEGRPRQAVQEILWLLETVSTAFRGQDTGTGSIEGKYFNTIVRELRTRRAGTVLARTLDWVAQMHGYLSSPTGGGVRHGTELAADVSPTLAEAHLYCNLTRSYINYLLAEIKAETPP